MQDSFYGMEITKASSTINKHIQWKHQWYNKKMQTYNNIYDVKTSAMKIWRWETETEQTHWDKRKLHRRRNEGVPIHLVQEPASMLLLLISKTLVFF